MAIEVVVSVLEEHGYLEPVFESRKLWELRMAWLDEQRELLQVSWDANLTFRLKDQLNLSYDKIDQLRFAFSHHRVGKRLVPRPWVVNPWTGARLNFPQPIAPRVAWQPLVKMFISDHGLRMDPSGTVAQRTISHVWSPSRFSETRSADSFPRFPRRPTRQVWIKACCPSQLWSSLVLMASLPLT